MIDEVRKQRLREVVGFSPVEGNCPRCCLVVACLDWLARHEYTLSITHDFSGIHLTRSMRADDRSDPEIWLVTDGFDAEVFYEVVSRVIERDFPAERAENREDQDGSEI